MPSYAGNVPFDPHISVPAPDIAKAGNYAEMLYNMGRNFGTDYRAGQEFNYQQRQRNLFQNGFPTDANGNPDYNKAMQMAVQAGGGEALTDSRLNYMLRQQIMGQPGPDIRSPFDTGGGGGGSGTPRGIRNNNPGNIEDGNFARSLPGYTGSDGRFATFDSPEAGANAQVQLLGRYAGQGVNTIAGVVSRWAPASDGNNVAAYANYVSRRLGIDPNQPLDLRDPAVAGRVAQAMGEFENGRQQSSRDGGQQGGAPGPTLRQFAATHPDASGNLVGQLLGSLHVTPDTPLNPEQARIAATAFAGRGGVNPNGVSGGGGPPGTSPPAPSGAPSTAAGVAGPGPAPLPQGQPGGGGPPPAPPPGPSGAPPVSEVTGVPSAAQTFRAPGRTQFPGGGTETMVGGQPIRPAATAATGPSGITGAGTSSAPPPSASPAAVAPPTGGFSPSGAPVTPPGGGGVGAGTPSPPVGGFAPGAPLPGGGATTAVTPQAPTSVLQGGGIHFAPGVSVTGIPLPEEAARQGLREDQVIQLERQRYDTGMQALAREARRLGLANINDSPELARQAQRLEVWNADATRREEALKTLATPSDTERTAARMNMNPIQYEAQRKVAEDQAAADVKYYDSLHRGLVGSGMIAAQQKQNIDILRQVAQSPNFSPGPGSDLWREWQRIKAQYGGASDQAAPREIFDQIAARVLSDQFSGMRSMSAETGEQGSRVFKSMLDLEERANITHEDSLSGIRAKLDLLDHTGDLMMRWADKADDYKQQHGRLDPGFDRELRGEIARARIPNAVPGNRPAGQTSGPAQPGGAYIWSPDHGLMPVQRGGAPAAPQRPANNSLGGLGPP